MFQNIERYIEFITRNHLSQQQFLLLYLIRHNRVSLMKMYMEAFPTADGSMIGIDSRNDLIKRGFLIKVDDGEGISSYRVGEAFEAICLRDRYEAAMQVWEMYPPFIKIGGNNIPLTTMDRYQFMNKYCERIDNNIDEHKEVLKDIEFGRERGLIRTTIEKFVGAETWRNIRAIRLGEAKIEEFRHESESL